MKLVTLQKVHYRIKFEPFFLCGRKPNGDMASSHELRNVTCKVCFERAQRDMKVKARQEPQP